MNYHLMVLIVVHVQKDVLHVQVVFVKLVLILLFLKVLCANVKMLWVIIILVHNVNFVGIFFMDVKFVAIMVLLLALLVSRVCFSMEQSVVIVIPHAWHVLLNPHALHAPKDLLYQ